MQIWRESRLMTVGMLLCALPLSSISCMIPLVAKGTPPTPGTWTGRLVSVKVVDANGVQHRAAALEIENGPRTLRRLDGTPTPAAVGADDVPYLSLDGGAIVSPEALGIVPGSRVRVRGSMQGWKPGLRIADAPGKPKVLRGVSRVEKEPPGESLLIRIHREPELLRG